MGSSLFWFENLTRLGALYFSTPPDLFCDELVQNINEVVLEDGWDVNKIREWLPEDFANHILENIKPPVACNVLDQPF